MIINEEELIWEKYVQESIVPFKKRKQIRKGISKKYGKDALKLYTFGFDIEFFVPYDEEGLEIRLKQQEFDVPPYDPEYEDWVVNKIGENPKYYDIEDWKKDNPKPDRSDFTYFSDKVDSKYKNHKNYEKYLEDAEEKDKEKFKKAYDEWLEKREEAEEEISEWISLYDYFLETSGDEYIEFLIDSGNWFDKIRINSDEIDGEIENLSDEIEEIVETHIDDEEKSESSKKWTVHEDEARHIEITSPILTTKDIPMAMDVLDVISGIGESNEKTSAHIHIGIPDDFDFFDLIVLYDLIDEKELNQIQPGREKQYTQSKNIFQKKLYGYLMKNYTDDDIVDISKLKDLTMEKNMGINISNVSGGISKREMGEKIKGGSDKSIEFRYLSSEIFDTPSGVKNFFEWIDYFILLMKLAQKRNQFSIKSSLEDEERKIILTRYNKDQIKINMDKAEMPDEKPSDIKQKESSLNSFYEYVKINENIYKNSDSKFKDKYEKPDFNNMSKFKMDEWWLKTPEHAANYIKTRGVDNNEEYLNRALDDYKNFLILNRSNIKNNLPNRLPKLEHILMYKKPYGSESDYEEMMMVLTMKHYIEKLNIDNDYINSFIQKYNEFENNKMKFEDVQKYFRELLYKINLKNKDND